MARSIWKGSIAFGLVNIPVSLVSAERRPDIQLHMVDSRNHARIRYERVNSDTGEEVPWDRLVKGYEFEDGKFILLSKEELDSVSPTLSKTIEISAFVDLSDIDPLLFEKPYYLQPDKRGRRAYVLLRDALQKTGKAGISRVVIRTREYLSALFARDEVLILMLLRFPQEIVAPAALEVGDVAANGGQPAKKEMDLAVRLIRDMETHWDPDEFHDEYRAALLEFIEKKVAGGETVEDVKERGEAPDPGGKVIDLAGYLERSFSARRKDRKAKTESPPATKKKKPKPDARKTGKEKTSTPPKSRAKRAKKAARRSA